MIPEQLIEMLVLDKIFENMQKNVVYDNIIRNKYDVEKMSTRQQELFDKYMYKFLKNYANN